MIIGKPFPCVSAFVDAIEAAIGAHGPGQGMSALQRAGLSFCRPAILVTNSSCGARFARASLGTYSLAALAWMFRPAKMPWAHLLVARVRVVLEHHGITSGTLVLDDSDKKRSKSAKALAHLYKLRDQESGGYLWGQTLVLLVFVIAKLTIPIGFTFYQPAPALRAWQKQERARKQQGGAKSPRLPKPPPNPQYPTQQELVLRLFQQCKDHHPALRLPCVTADALYGSATFVEAASAICGGVQGIAQIRSNQQVRVYTRAQPVADSFAPPPGTPQHSRSRGGEEMMAIVGSARMQVCAHKTKRFSIALQHEDAATYRSLMASDLSWRPLDIVQGYPRRWLVEVFVQDWTSPAGWNQLPQQPGPEGACRSVILSPLVDHALFFPPDHHAQLKNNRPAYTVGSLRANVQVECLGDVMQSLVASDDPQGQWHRFTQTWAEVFTFGRSTKHMSQRQLGRLEPTPSLQYRADEVMRNMPILST